MCVREEWEGEREEGGKGRDGKQRGISKKSNEGERTEGGEAGRRREDQRRWD